MVLEKNMRTSMQEQGIGKSKGGLTSKLHACCDALGTPLRFFITAGERSDYTKALDLIKGESMEALIADKDYDAIYIIKAVTEIGAEAVIPPRSNRIETRSYESELYKERNLIERMFSKLKHFRRVATIYDKLDITYLAFVLIAGIHLWLK